MPEDFSMDQSARITLLQEQGHKYQQQAERLGKELAEIKGSLNLVAVYSGMVDVSPTALLVSELVRDHEELEARIDAALHLLNAEQDGTEFNPILAQIAHLLRGGARVPETIEGIDG